MTAQTAFIVSTTEDGDTVITIPQQRTVARHKPLVISQYLADRGMPVDLVRRHATNFGKVLRTEYLKEHGREPEKVERWIGGKNREVSSYTTADKKLFDRVYGLICG